MLPRIVAVVLAVPLAAMALVMLFDPSIWYDAFPGVSDTGPLNPHFVRDLGCAFLVEAGVLLVYALARTPPVSALAAMAAFVSLHALVHAGELFKMTGLEAAQVLLRDLPAVYLPPVLLIWFTISAARRARADALLDFEESRA